MDKRTKVILKYVVSIALAVVLLYFSFRNVKWSDFWTALSSCHWEFVLLSMAFGYAGFWLRSLRWRMTLLPIDEKIDRLTCLNAVNISYVVNLVLPRAGELARCGYVTKHSEVGPDGRKKASLDKVLGTVVLDRLWDLLSLIIILLATLLFFRERFSAFLEWGASNMHFSPSWLLVGLVVAVGLAVAAVWLLRDKNRLCGKIWELVRGVGQGLTTCLHMKQGWLFIVYTILIWGTYVMTSASIIWAVQDVDLSAMGAAGVMDTIAGMDMMDAFLLMVAGALSSLVPVPGGFGAFHYVVSLFLQSVYGIPMAVGMVFATLSHESQILTQVIAGLSSYAIESFRKGIPGKAETK